MKGVKAIKTVIVSGNKLISAMNSANISIAELSERSGVSRKTIQLIMDDVAQSTKIDTIKNLAWALSIAPMKLLEDEKC